LYIAALNISTHHGGSFINWNHLALLLVSMYFYLNRPSLIDVRNCLTLGGSTLARLLFDANSDDIEGSTICCDFVQQILIQTMLRVSQMTMKILR